MKTNTSSTWLESLFTPSLIHLCSKSFCAKFYNKVGMRAKRTNEGGGGGGGGRGEERTKHLPTSPTILKAVFAHKRSFWLVRCL